MQDKILNDLKEIFGEQVINDRVDDILVKIPNTAELYNYNGNKELLNKLFNDFLFDSNLFKRYIIPPFSVLDTKQGVWRDRKNIIDSVLGSSIIGRKDGLAYGNLKVRNNDNGTSQFDSVLCEILLKWFSVKNGTVYDCFAGGHIRGTMSSLLGLKYIGIELNIEQVTANNNIFKGLQLSTINTPVWNNDDALNADMYLQDNSCDLLFTCPPYGDLEKYTDDPRDLSNMEYSEFIKNYELIIQKGINKLKNDRFAVFVVGDFRDSNGFYRGFVSDTIKAFEKCGVKLYNELILLNNIGTAPMRANNGFTNRKMVKIHQNVLVFYKGNPENIKNIYGQIDSAYPVPILEQNSLF